MKSKAIFKYINLYCTRSFQRHLSSIKTNYSPINRSYQMQQ